MIRWLLVLVVLGFGRVAPAGPSSSGMKTLQTQSYVLHTDLEQAEAEAIGSHLDTMNVAYRELFSGFRMPPRTPMDVYVFQTEEAYLRFLRDSFGGDGTGSGGMFITRGSRKALVCWKGDGGMEWVREVLQHEGFHQFAAELFPGIPVWANEGFAELFGHAVVVDGNVVLGEVPPGPLARLQQARAADALVPFNDFFEIDSSTWSSHVQSGSAGLQYAQAWSLVHFFLYAQEGRWQQQFMSFLDQMNRGMEWQSVFRSTFKVESWSEIQPAFLAYLESMQASDYRRVIQQLEFLASGMQFLSRQEVYPSTLQLLRQNLQTRRFEFTSHLFGAVQHMKADDDSLYRLPGTDGSTSMPHLVLADDRGKPLHGSTGGARRPWNIGTMGLEPRNFMVWWDRGRDGWTFRLGYE